MQLVFPWLRSAGRRARPEPPPAVIQIGTHTLPVTIARHRRARRYVLRLTKEGRLRLTIPRGASIAGGLAFAKRQGAWIRREQTRHLVRERPWADGDLVWFRGEQVPIRVGESTVTFGLESMARPRDGSRLREVFGARVRALASAELPSRCTDLARQHGLSVSRVTIRNQRSRWGSCSSRGTIALNWRLLQMPPQVSDYVILHELMHLRQPNHSRQFWREVAAVCEGWRAAEKWLRTHGRELF